MNFHTIFTIPLYAFVKIGIKGDDTVAKWICIANDDERLLTVVENALKNHGYLTESVSGEAVQNKIRADVVLNYRKAPATNCLTLGNLTMDLDSVTAYTNDGGDIHFTPIEFSMLSFLIQNAHRAVPRSELLSVVWGYENGSSTRVADDTAKRLRRKLSATTVSLETVWNYGFRVREK